MEFPGRLRAQLQRPPDEDRDVVAMIVDVAQRDAADERDERKGEEYTPRPCGAIVRAARVDQLS
jgi:hypothetical protein